MNKAFAELNREYLKQIGEEYTPENVEEYGLCEEYMELAGETKGAWLVIYNEAMPVLNIVFKYDRCMESVEL